MSLHQQAFAFHLSEIYIIIIYNNFISHFNRISRNNKRLYAILVK